MEDVKAVMISSGLVDKALSDEYLEKLNEEARHVCLSDRPNDDGAPYPVICMDGTVIYKICENPRIEKGEISLEDVGEVLVRQRIHYAENNLNYR